MTLEDTVIGPDCESSASGGAVFVHGGSLTVGGESSIAGQLRVGLGGTKGGIIRLTSDAIESGGLIILPAAGNPASLVLQDDSVIGNGHALIGWGNAQDGGCIHATGVDAENPATVALSGNASVRACSAEFVTGTPQGGLVYAMDTVVTLADAATLEFGDALDGGAGGCLALRGSSSVVATAGTTLQACDAEGNGGAIDASAQSSVTIDGAALIANEAEENGGAIFSDGLVILTGATMENNVAGLAGGGLYATASATLTLTDTTVATNTAGADGGGISTHGPVDVTDGTFNGNAAAGNGGALALFDTSLVDGGDTTWTSNTSGAAGGGVFASKAAVTLADSVKFLDNVAETHGGGLALVPGNGVMPGSGWLTVTGTPFENPEPFNIANPELGNTGFATGGVRFKGNAALTGDGGAIWCPAAVPFVNPVRSRFVILADNVAPEGRGGGLFLDNGCSLGLENSRIAVNVADEAAGVYVGVGSGFELVGRLSPDPALTCVMDPVADADWENRSCAELSGNVADAGPGGLLAVGAQVVNLTRVRFDGNDGGLAGTAHIEALANTPMTLDNVILMNGIGLRASLADDAATLTARHTTFADAAINAVWQGASTAVLHNDVFWGGAAGGLDLVAPAVALGRCNAGHGDIDLITWPAGGPTRNADEEDPLFVTTIYGDYHLDPTSPSADICQQGANVDLDGSIRPIQVKPGVPPGLRDRGAFECTL